MSSLSYSAHGVVRSFAVEAGTPGPGNCRGVSWSGHAISDREQRICFDCELCARLAHPCIDSGGESRGISHIARVVTEATGAIANTLLFLALSFPGAVLMYCKVLMHCKRMSQDALDGNATVAICRCCYDAYRQC